MSITDIIKNSVLDQFTPQTSLTVLSILIMFAVTSIFAAYIFVIYKFNSKRSFYYPNFAKTLVGLPIITATIIIAMQINILVSLGMVGALSIVRFRNAVKDPLDLLFLFWSITVGIVCGTGAYTLALIASIVITVVIWGLDFIPNNTSTYLLSIKCTREVNEEELMEKIKEEAKGIKVRTRNANEKNITYLIELHTKKDQNLVNSVMNISGVLNTSCIAHDGEVRV